MISSLERGGYELSVPAEIDVKSIRKGLRTIQARFSDAFGFSLAAVKTRGRWPTYASLRSLQLLRRTRKRLSPHSQK